MDTPSPVVTGPLTSRLRTLLHTTRNTLQFVFMLTIAAYTASIGFTCAIELLSPLAGQSVSDTLPPLQFIAGMLVLIFIVLLPWRLAIDFCRLMWMLLRRFFDQMLPKLMQDGSLRQMLEIPVYSLSLVAMFSLAMAAGVDLATPLKDVSITKPELLVLSLDFYALFCQTASAAWHFMWISLPLALFAGFIYRDEDGDGGHRVRRPVNPKKAEQPLLDPLGNRLPA